MSVVKPRGYADIATLRKAAAVLTVPGGAQETSKGHVLGLCRQLAEVLKPFAQVEGTNERWRDEILAITEMVREAATALRIDDPALGMLSESIDALEDYERRIARIEVEDRMMEEDTMDAHAMMDRLEQTIQQLATPANRSPVDEWQLNRDATLIREYCHSLVSKLIDYLDNEKECNRAGRLLERVADVISAAAAVDGLSAATREQLSRSATVAGESKQNLEKYRERWRMEQR